jgi:MFS family permease
VKKPTLRNYLGYAAGDLDATYILGNSSQLIWMVLATSLATFVAVPVVPRFVTRMGKKNTFLIGAVGLVLAGTWIFFMPNAPADRRRVILRLRPFPESVDVLVLHL